MKKDIHLPKKFGIRKGAEKFPLLVLVLAASPCNARCPHCPATAEPKVRKTEDLFLKLEYFKKIADECSKFNADIRISGYGEPLLSPDLVEMIEYGRSKNCKISLITNGSLFEEKSIKRIIEAEIDAIEISADSHKAEIYSRIRVGLDFNKVKENIFKLVETRNELNKKTSIMVSIIDQPSRNPEIKEAEKFWEKIVDKVLIRKYLTWGVLPTDNCRKSFLDPKKRQPCPHVFERIMIDPAGYFRLCSYDDQQLIPAFGHISKNSIQEFWLSKRLENIRTCHLEYRFEDAELCNKCTDWMSRSWTYHYWKGLEDARKRRKNPVF